MHAKDDPIVLGDCVHVSRMGVTQPNDIATAPMKTKHPQSNTHRSMKVALDPCSSMDEFRVDHCVVDGTRCKVRV